MNTYTVEAHYRYGNDEKDHFQEDIVAENTESASLVAKAIRRNIFSVWLLAVNGVKEEIVKRI